MFYRVISTKEIRIEQLVEAESEEAAETIGNNVNYEDGDSDYFVMVEQVSTEEYLAYIEN